MMAAQTPTPDRPRPSGRGLAALRTPRAAGVAGVIFAVLFATALVITGIPAQGSGKSFATWYTGEGSTALVIAGLYLIPFAGIAFLWFIGVVRERVGEREDRLFSTVFLGSGLLFVAMMFTAYASATALALRIDAMGWSGQLDTGSLQLVRAITYALLFVYSARTAGVFMIVTSTIALRTRSVPRWVAIVGYLIALVLLLSISAFELVILLFPLWVGLFSVWIIFVPPLDPVDGEAVEQAG
jgi:hypothetical protein